MAWRDYVGRPFDPYAAEGHRQFNEWWEDIVAEEGELNARFTLYAEEEDEEEREPYDPNEEDEELDSGEDGGGLQLGSTYELLVTAKDARITDICCLQDLRMAGGEGGYYPLDAFPLKSMGLEAERILAEITPSEPADEAWAKWLREQAEDWE